MFIAPSILSPTEGEKFVFQPYTITARVLPSQTGGTFELFDLQMGVSQVDYHVHNRMDETLCVIEGEVEFTVAGQKYIRPAGSVAFVPRGIHHGFKNLGPAPARVLIIFSPTTNQSEFFRKMGVLLSAPTVDADAVRAVQLEYDQELIDPNE